MNIRRFAAVAGIVAGLVVVSGGALVGAGAVLHARAGVPTAGEPTPILGPITPAGHPYDELAILRRQRMSVDVLPASLVSDLASGDDSSKIVAGSARLLLERGDEREYLVVEASGGLCIYSLALGQDGYTAACRDSSVTYKPGTEVLGGAASGYDQNLQIVTDGTPAPGVIHRGSRHVAPNVWLGRASKGVVPVVAAYPHDPLAVPLQAPYSEYAILRRAATAADTEPASWTTGDDGSGLAGGVIQASLRRAGTYRGTTVWVGVQGDGGTCLIMARGKTLESTSCGGGAVEVSAGDNGDGGTFLLQPDHVSAGDGPGPGAHRLAPNVWQVPTPKG